MFAKHVGISQTTFFKYINPNLEERRTLGNGARRNEMLLTHEDIKITGAVLARADRRNNGMARMETTDLV